MSQVRCSAKNAKNRYMYVSPYPSLNQPDFVGKSIFNLDKIFFPINLNNEHWVCAVAFMHKKRIQFYDSQGGDGIHYLEILFRYIKDEYLDKNGVPLPDQDDWELVPCAPDTPHQRNGMYNDATFLFVPSRTPTYFNVRLSPPLAPGYDCGVFTCMFADFLAKDCPLVFNQSHITQCREHIAVSIMNGQAIM
jgi:sentrin-specific protease 1